jgi:hypothetical protein
MIRGCYKHFSPGVAAGARAVVPRPPGDTAALVSRMRERPLDLLCHFAPSVLPGLTRIFYPFFYPSELAQHDLR